jgi:hypothetical protein
MTIDTTTQLREDLNEARSDFRRTAAEMRRHLETGQKGLHKEIRRSPVKSIAVAGVLGFLMGRASRPAAVFFAMVTGVAIGYSIANRDRAALAHAEPAHDDETSRSDAG